MKQAKDLSFGPLEAKFINSICGPSPHGQKILVDSAVAHEGFSVEALQSLRADLNPGPELDTMSHVVCQGILQLSDQIAGDGSCSEIGLCSWLRDNITSTTTDMLWGPQNPFKDHKLVEEFW